MILKDQRVKIPKKVKIIKKGDNKYVYFVAATEYKKDKKYNVDKRVNIGKVDPENEKLLIPNEKYFLVFPNTEITIVEDNKNISSVVSIGQYLAIRKIFKDLFIDEQLENIFGAESELIKALISYYIDEEPMDSKLFEKWAYKNFSGLFSIPSNSTISILLNKEISTEKILEFNQRWSKQSRTYLEYSDDAYLSVDSTNFNIGLENIKHDEYGKPKVDEGFSQINLSYCLDQKMGLPVFYDLYPGSINDVSYCKKMIDKALDLRYKSATLALDNGYFSTDNIENITNENIDFVIMAKTYNEKLSKLLKDNKAQIYRNAENLIFEHNVFGWKTHEQAFTKSSKKYFIYMFYNDEKALVDVDKYNTTLKILSKQLEGAKYLTEDIYRTYGNYFDFKVDEDNKIMSYEINKKNYQDVLDNSGYFVIVSTHDWEPRKILEFYKMRDVVEKTFKSLKSNIEFKEANVQPSIMFESKMFLSFVASIIRSAIFYKIKPFLKNHSETIESALSELSKIEMVKEYKFYKFKYVLTARQKELLDLLDIDSEFIKTTMEEINFNLF